MQKLEADGLHWLYAFLESMVWADQFDEHEADLEIFCFVLLFSISVEKFFLLSVLLYIFLSCSHYPVILLVPLYYYHLINFVSLLCRVIWLIYFLYKSHQVISGSHLLQKLKSTQCSLFIGVILSLHVLISFTWTGSSWTKVQCGKGEQTIFNLLLQTTLGPITLKYHH